MRELKPITFYSTPKQYAEEIYHTSMMEANREGLTEFRFADIEKACFENFIYLLNEGEMIGVYLLDNPVFQEVLGVENCRNKLETYSLEKIKFLNKKIQELERIENIYSKAMDSEENTSSVSINRSTSLKSIFSLSKTLSKIDYIRIVNALSELRCFKKEDGTYPTKKEVMQAFGSLVNVDLSDHSNAMNKAFNSNVSLEQNIEIFKKLEQKTQQLYLNNQNKPKK